MFNRIVDHIVIWVLCMIMVIVFGTSARFVVAGILSIIIVCLNQVFSIDDRLYEGIIIIYMACALFFPAFMSYLPCLLYDVFVKKYKGAMGVRCALSTVCGWRGTPPPSPRRGSS